MEYFNASSGYCSDTLQRYYVYNLTNSYADQSNEGTMVTTSVVMFILAVLFFNLNLFSRFSDISAVLNPSIRLFLSTSLSLFLPVMSYLFSEAKNNGGGSSTAACAAGQKTPELSLRARIILMWMLLVELLRKKVEAMILVSAGGGVAAGYSGTIERAARIAWLGYLVFYHLISAGKKALYGIIWVLAAGKLVQRFVILELGKRSFAYGKNPQLLTSYMTKMLQLEQQQQQQQHATVVGGSELLKRCKYVVMGEEDLEKKADPNGYQLVELAETRANPEDDPAAVVTVRKIWKLTVTDELLKNDPKLKTLCLSLALYKLLRRRLEDIPITDAEASNCHDLIFEGLCKETGGTDDEDVAAARLFRVFNDEVQFLCEYYHSVHPVVFASPYFFLVNYALFPVVVWAVCVLTIILCSNGDVRYASYSFSADNYAVSFGIMRMAGCILSRATKNHQDLYATVDISITVLLVLAFAYEEVWELLVFLLSNWFMVSLLCSYAPSSTSYSRRPRRRSRSRPLLSGVIRGILWVRSWLSHTNVCVKQLSVLWFLRLPWWLPTRAVPVEAKKAIMQRLAKSSCVAHPSNVWLMMLSDEHSQLALAQAEPLLPGNTDGVAKVILIWHIATVLLEAKHPLPKQQNNKQQQAQPGPSGSRKVASALSGYCAYLVAFHPELLPDDRDGTEREYKDTKEEMMKEMGCCGYYLARHRKMTEIAERPQQQQPPTTTTLGKGARLGKALVDMYEDGDEAARERVWRLPADVWTEVVVYAAPTGSEVHVKAHKEALAQGGEFITVLWAMATHTGISRHPPPACTV